MKHLLIPFAALVLALTPAVFAQNNAEKTIKPNCGDTALYIRLVAKQRDEGASKDKTISFMQQALPNHKEIIATIADVVFSPAAQAQSPQELSDEFLALCGKQ